MEIRPVLTQEVDLLAALAAKLWPHHSKEELSEEFCEFLSCGIIFAAFEDSQIGYRAILINHNSYNHPPLWKDVHTAQSDIWRASLYWKNIDKKASPVSCFPAAKSGLKNKAAGNLPAIVSWIIPRAFPFILPVVLRKQIELSVLRKRYKWS
jgi:hypothetical protein